jgi:hypothetical protein
MKKWNPYIRRHTGLTEKSKMKQINEHQLRQLAGWSPRSQMHLKYIHYFGNEASESLLEAYGIVTTNQESAKTLHYKQCPNCNEPNKPDSKFCVRCRMVLTYDAYNETIEEQKENEDKLEMMEEKFTAMQSQMQTILSVLSSINTENGKQEIAKELILKGIYKNEN